MSETRGLGHPFALTEILPGKNVHSIATGADRVHVVVFPHSLHPRLVISCVHVSCAEEQVLAGAFGWCLIGPFFYNWLWR